MTGVVPALTIGAALRTCDRDRSRPGSRLVASGTTVLTALAAVRCP
ncbi:hypothetical protein [Streptomyces sp. enrichment culture]